MLAKVISRDDEVQHLGLASTERAGGLEAEVFEKAYECKFASICQNRHRSALVLQLSRADR